MKCVINENICEVKIDFFIILVLFVEYIVCNNEWFVFKLRDLI